jgi:hypothetical protein
VVVLPDPAYQDGRLLDDHALILLRTDARDPAPAPEMAR